MEEAKAYVSSPILTVLEKFQADLSLSGASEPIQEKAFPSSRRGLTVFEAEVILQGFEIYPTPGEVLACVWHLFEKSPGRAYRVDWRLHDSAYSRNQRRPQNVWIINS